MTEHEPGSRLDTAIDRAVRRMMDVEPPDGLRRRVLQRLEEPASPFAWWPRLGLAAATLAAILLAVVYFRPAAPERHVTPQEQILAQAPLPVMPPPDGDSPETSAGVPEAPPAPTVTPGDTARTARVERLPDPPRVDDVFGPRPDGRVAAATVDAPGRAGPDPLPEIEPLQVPLLAGTVALEAQDPPAAQAEAPAPGPVNIRVDLTLTEEGEGAPAPKTVSMLVASHEMGRVRSGGGGIVLNVDARPSILPDGRVRVMLTLEYSPGGLAQMSQSLTTVLENGTPLVVSKAVDPKGTRRVQAELTATISK
jgi:hypothetical protein